MTDARGRRESHERRNARCPSNAVGTASDAVDPIRKRFVLRVSEDDTSVDDMAVAEGIVGDG